jgi:hypothetical protein
VIPHSSSQVYPETCTPSFLAGPDSGLVHHVIARYFGALEQAFAFGGADDAATHRLKEVQPIYVGILCSLQLRNPHTGKRNRVVSIHRDYRARAGLMR